MAKTSTAASTTKKSAGAGPRVSAWLATSFFAVVGSRSPMSDADVRKLLADLSEARLDLEESRARLAAAEFENKALRKHLDQLIRERAECRCHASEDLG
jgi:hypothetical protein